MSEGADCLHNYERARECAALVGLELRADEDGLVLSDGQMQLRAGFEHMKARVQAGKLNRELIVRAAKLKRSARDGGEASPTAVDATAGLGEDSLLLAAAGFEVRLVERNPVIFALLGDAIARAARCPDLCEAAARMQAVEADSVVELGRLAQAPDLVLLDPMFPARQKSSAVKKKLQLLQRLERPCEDEMALLWAAVGAKPRKILVKRPLKGPYLAQAKPDYSIKGKAVRYDCYTSLDRMSQAQDR